MRWPSGVALIADLLWASSTSSSARSFTYKPAFDWPPPKTSSDSFPLPVSSNHSAKVIADKDKKDELHGRILSKTFADLPGPELKWEKMSEAPVPRLDGAAIQIKDELFVFAGYGTIDLVHSHVDIYNFTSNTWGGRFDMPKEMAHSHLGMVTDGRYIYIVTGQYGPQCRGPTAHTFVLDTKTKKWEDMPPLPVPRSLEHCCERWKSFGERWRIEMPIPRGGPHRACIVVDDRLYTIGGQEGDFMAKPNSPIFKCSRRNEVVYSDVYMLDDEMKWKVLPPMPKPDSHIEFAWAVFQLDTLKWSVVGKLPFRVKTTLVGFWDGWLYFTSGQRDRGVDDPTPKKVIGEMWRTKTQIVMTFLFHSFRVKRVPGSEVKKSNLKGIGEHVVNNRGQKKRQMSSEQLRIKGC
ncbi:unnamed protein product [Lactuca saligna]|uniref:Kelch repeat-containing protein n=1 Tax=Lactuca saligna TaxID=75948 RepID=A0AA36E2R0_LACSI|nr:unnamed protein product [Lactuca saligna]